jgi:hypothetical protein
VRVIKGGAVEAVREEPQDKARTGAVRYQEWKQTVKTGLFSERIFGLRAWPKRKREPEPCQALSRQPVEEGSTGAFLEFVRTAFNEPD